MIEEEVNVKAINFESDSEKFGKRELKIRGSIGARLKGEMPKVMTAAKEGRWSLLEDGKVEIEGHLLEPDDFSVSLKMREGIVGKALDSHDGIVILDTNISQELEREGIARDLIRLIQMSRREANLDISDQIALVLDLPADFLQVIEEHKEYICNETLSDSLTVSTHLKEDYHTYKHDLHSREVVISFSRI